jgi:hypothetical protein
MKFFRTNKFFVTARQSNKFRPGDVGEISKLNKAEAHRLAKNGYISRWHQYYLTIIITTYNRRKSLNNLLSQIRNSAPSGYRILIFDDHSRRKMIIDGDDVIYYYSDINFGKQGYYNVWNKIMELLPDSRYYITLPDDCILRDGFFTEAIRLWKRIHTPKIILEIAADQRTGKKQWNMGTPTRITNELWRQHWTDLCFICQSELWERLGKNIYPIPESRWHRNPGASSGVAQQISRRVGHYGIYSVARSLITLLDIKSKMNPAREGKIISV